MPDVSLTDFVLARLTETQAAVERGHLTAPALAGCPEWDNRTSVEVPPAVACMLLVDLQAKRAIVEMHPVGHREIGWLTDDGEEYAELPVCGRCVPKNAHYLRREDVPDRECRTVRMLALPYAGHPEYRAEWAPVVDRG